MLKLVRSGSSRMYGRLLFFALLFGGVKLSGFSAALLLSSIAGLADYGRFEYALAVGLLLALPLNMGLQGAYPYFNLRMRQRGYRSIFYFHALLMGGALALLIGSDMLFFHWLPPQLATAGLLGGVIALQVLVAAILKSHEKILRAVLLEGGFFLLVNVLVAVLFFTQRDFEFYQLQYLLLGYLLSLLGVYTYHWNKSRADFSWMNYIIALRYGRHLVLSSFLLLLLTGSARIFVEYFLDIQTVGHYAFYLRFAMISIMIQQVFLIAFFRKIYQSEPSLLDRYYAPFLAAILLFSLGLWWGVPLFLSDYLPLLAASSQAYRLLYFTLCFHCIGWICLAFNENIIHRENLSARMNRGLLLLFAAMLVILLLLHYSGSLTVELLAIVNLLTLFGATELQFYLLYTHRGICLRRAQLVHRLILVVFGLGVGAFGA